MRVNHINIKADEKQIKAIPEEPLYYWLNEFPYEGIKERLEKARKPLTFKFGEITIWAGACGQTPGKTTLLTQLAKDCIKQGEKVFFFNR